MIPISDFPRTIKMKELIKLTDIQTEDFKRMDKALDDVNSNLEDPLARDIFNKIGFNAYYSATRSVIDGDIFINHEVKDIFNTRLEQRGKFQYVPPEVILQVDLLVDLVKGLEKKG